MKANSNCIENEDFVAIGGHLEEMSFEVTSSPMILQGFRPGIIKFMAAVHVAEPFIFSKPHLSWQRNLWENRCKKYSAPSLLFFSLLSLPGPERRKRRPDHGLNTNLSRHLSHTVHCASRAVWIRGVHCPILHGTLLPKGIRQRRGCKHNSFFLFAACQTQ